MNKRSQKMKAKVERLYPETATTRNLLQYEDSFARFVHFKVCDHNRPGEIKFKPAQLLPFLRQEDKFWDQFEEDTFDGSLKIVRVLNKHLNKLRRSKAWL